MILTAESIAAFFITSILLGLSPGPDNIFVLTQSVVKGRMAGFLVTFGLCTGLMFHTVAVAIGVSAVFQASALAFTGLKFIGAAYLLYLAWKAFRAPAEHLSARNAKALEKWVLYRRGIIMNITNPKVAIFFLAFLPQFVSPESGHLTLQLILLGAFFILATLLVFGSIALLSGTLKNWFNHSDKAQKLINKIAGVIFVGLAIKLVTTTR